MSDNLNNLKTSLVLKSNKRDKNNIFKNYDDYVYWQCVPGLSFEKDNEKWTNGQIRCIEDKFKNLNRDLKILDICCGDGRGLKKLKQMGFKNITGVEISDEKIKIAKSFANVIKIDICCFDNNLPDVYDVIYSSHTIEHVLDPIYTINKIKKHLKPDGIMFLILPYPDYQAADPNLMGGHNFKVHCGVMPLGLHLADKGETVCNIIKNIGFEIIKCDFSIYREPEIHLTLKNIYK